ncbi:FimV/HubP family polar landmark protein, partial [Colwellia ponticola]
MQKFLRLCLWQAIIIGILTVHFPVSAEEEGGIRLRGPKSIDVSPYNQYGPITGKDTLWNIATRVRPDKRLSVYQVMQALYQENPQAFLDNNINHLVEGQTLNIPSFSKMMAINTNTAKQKSLDDEKAWEKIQPKPVEKIISKEPSIQKKDLETVKTEINDQLQKIDGQQQQRLATIQNDISDSIDGLQAILKENDNLRQRLNVFNDKLSVMQDEVAKAKEIKLQMNDMITLQQALLAKAEAREKELLLEKQQAELAEQSMTSSLWFKIVMGTMPAALILSLLALLFKRRKQASDEVFFNELDTKKEPAKATKDSAAEELSLADELDLSIDDELSLDDELDLSLDDEVSLEDELGLEDDLAIDNDILVDDDVIHLDDDDDLNDLEDILLDDDSEPLEGGELDQDDLDSLLSGLDEETDKTQSPVSEELEGGELNQDDLNELLNGLDDIDDDDLAFEEPAKSNNEAKSETKNEVTEKAAEPLAAKPDGSNNDDANTDDTNTELSDPDDIDALLESMSGETPAAETAPAVEKPVADEANKVERAAKPDDSNNDDANTDDANTELSDPDDIDALLESMSGKTPAAETAPAVEKPVADEANKVERAAKPDDSNNDDANTDDANTELSDPDDIDALLESMSGEKPAADDGNTELSDPDDIDALLESMSGEKPAADDGNIELSDPDDIDALLESMSGETPAADDGNTELSD